MKTYPAIDRLIAVINAEMKLVESAMKLGMPRPVKWDDPDARTPYDRAA